MKLTHLGILCVLLGISHGAFAIDSSTKSAIETQLHQELHNLKDPDFLPILKNWQQNHPHETLPILLQIAADEKLSDADRYVALMGAAKLGGVDIAHALTPFLSDSSWMLRSGALQALRILKDPATSPAALALVQDPALVVRREAVTTVQSLNPPGANAALLRALFAPENYNNGKALWIPQAALRALAALNAREIIRELRPLLLHFGDPELQSETIRTLEKLTGKSAIVAGRSIAAQALIWEKSLR